jgi:peptidoglycan/xylan/chitin deacetylase (PgdA/CDA1 family)
MKNHLAKMLSLFVESVPKVVLKRYFNGIVPVFMLHRLPLSDNSKTQQYHEHIKWCLSYIRKHGYQPISLTELALKYKDNETIPPKTVVFTIDDGFSDQFEHGIPLFSEFDTPLTCFVITQFLDGSLWPWDDQISYILSQTHKVTFNLTLPSQEDFSFSNTKENYQYNVKTLRNKLKTLDQTNLYDWLAYLYNQAEVDVPLEIPADYQAMSWSDAQKFIDAGHKIAAHTKTHRILSQLNAQEAEQEIIGSYNKVKSRLQGACDVFAYPTGRPVDYGEREKLILEKNNILCSVNTEAFHFKQNSNIFDIPRFSLPESRFDFIQYLSFFEELKCRIKK